MSGERAFTDRLGERFPQPPELIVPIGDDAAVVPGSPLPQAMAVDPVVEGVHFAVGTDWDLVGAKSVNRNLSDLAAMGAAPQWLLVSLVLRPDLAPVELDGLLDGIAGAAARAAVVVVGGDTTVAAGPVVVTVTAVGSVPGRALVRSGAKVGDRIHVSGPVGAGRGDGHLTFTPQLDLGLWLAEQPGVSAAMDVSDGVLLDLHTLLLASSGGGSERGSASGQSACAPPVLGAALDRHGFVLAHPDDDLEAALCRGEDHVLLFTVAEGVELPETGPLPAQCRRPVGVVEAAGGIRMETADGFWQSMRPKGWQHRVPT